MGESLFVNITNQTTKAADATQSALEQPALFVTFKDEPDYQGGRELTIDAAFCVTPNVAGESYPRGGDQPLQSLHFIMRGGSCALRYSEGKEAFHSSVSICFNDLYFANLEDMEAKTKALRSVHRKLDAMREKFGYATNPLELLGRFADAVGAVGIYFANDDDEKRATGEKFRFRARADGLAQIRHLAARMAEKIAQPVGAAA